MKVRGSLSRLATGSIRPLVLAILALLSLTAISATDARTITLQKIGDYQTGFFDEGGSEIVAYSERSQRLYSVNAAETSVDIIDLSDPANPTLVSTIDASAYGASANSVAVYGRWVAVAIEADPKTDPGKLVFFDLDGNYVNDLTIGALPDMVTFTARGRYVVVANEGEPNDDYSIDPEGTVSIIEVGRNPGTLTQADVKTADFNAFNDAELDPSIRIFGPGATVAQDVEPEYITTTRNQRWAYVTLQENNAIALVDLKKAEVKSMTGLGFKDHSLKGNGLDASDKDDAVNIANWPVYGMFQPDAIVSYTGAGGEFLVTANEGDARDYDTFAEEERVKDLVLDPTAFPNAEYLQEDENLGRLTVSTVNGQKAGSDEYEALYAFGARSFSIWDTEGNLLYDSGDTLEQVTAAAYPTEFNSNNDENDSFDNRSDNKGPEPEELLSAA
ncbi:MAG: choice-of-anchor I family protein [Chloroflexota bacterium]